MAANCRHEKFVPHIMPAAFQLATFRPLCLVWVSTFNMIFFSVIKRPTFRSHYSCTFLMPNNWTDSIWHQNPSSLDSWPATGWDGDRSASIQPVVSGDASERGPIGEGSTWWPVGFETSQWWRLVEPTSGTGFHSHGMRVQVGEHI